MKLTKLMYCEAHKCKLRLAACIARRLLAEKQFEEEGKPRKQGRPKKKLTLLNPEKCLECKDGLKELRSDQVPGITDEGIGAKTCTKCGEEKGNHHFDRGKDVCVLCKIREKDLADSAQIKADIKKADHIKPTQQDEPLTLDQIEAALQVEYNKVKGEILTLDFSIVDGLMDALKKAADEDVRTVEQQALFMLKLALYS